MDGALALLDEAERLYMSDFSPNVRPIAALRTRVWIAQGRLGEALDWVGEQGVSADDDLSPAGLLNHAPGLFRALAVSPCETHPVNHHIWFRSFGLSWNR